MFAKVATEVTFVGLKQYSLSTCALSREIREDHAWWLDDRSLLMRVPSNSLLTEMLQFLDASESGLRCAPEQHVYFM